MAEPQDMIVRELREMRAENAALHTEFCEPFAAVERRFDRIEDNIHAAATILAARAAVARASRRRPLAGSSA